MANCSESFVPQTGTTAGKKPFDAEESTQYEIGARFDIGNTGLQANAAVFTITKENLTTTDPATPDFEAALGEVESKGFEISVSGYMQPNWFLGVAYGYLDTEITRNFDGLKGKHARAHLRTADPLRHYFRPVAGTGFGRHGGVCGRALWR